MASSYTGKVVGFTKEMSSENSITVKFDSSVDIETLPGKYIYINNTPKIIGKDSERAQIIISYDGISRLHALVVKEGKECMVEDLNSTNGTKINEETLEPRKRYVLQQGDKVSFAGVDYIFR